MTHQVFRLIGLSVILLTSIACGTTTSAAPAPNNTPIAPAQPGQLPATETTSNPAAETGCEDFFPFCVTSTVSGAVTAKVTAGVGNSASRNCTAWAASGKTRSLELPLMLAAGQEKMTVALTRIGAYTGPGKYELKAVTTGGLPDNFPAIEVAGRAFSNGADSTAMVTIAPDGSGSIQSVGLVEQASIQVANPDPAARITFSMQWTCQNVE
jgi:hypothetical protein